MSRIVPLIQAISLSLFVVVASCDARIRHRGPSRHETPEMNRKEANVVGEVEDLDGEVTIDEKSANKCVIGINLKATKVSDAWLEHLKELTALQSLNLNGTNVTDAGLEHLKGLTNLRSLALFSTKVTDAGLQHLKGLTNLRELYIPGTNPALRSEGTNVTDVGLQHLRGLTNLEALNLKYTNVSDEGLKHLKGLSKLKDLELAHVQCWAGRFRGLASEEPRFSWAFLEL